VGLALISLLTFELLPQQYSQKKTYQILLWGMEISSLGMAFSFPFRGYTIVSVSFSSLYIFVFLFFAYVFIKDVLRSQLDRNVKLLGISAIVSSLVSFIGPLGLVYILISRAGSSNLYRDSIYVFLHFQYNGFFTLSVFALLINQILQAGNTSMSSIQNFSRYLCLSVPPTLFLALLWHNNTWFYTFAILGCVLIVITLIYFFQVMKHARLKELYPGKLSRTLLYFALISFGIKMLLQIGTVIPQLGNAVYGDRPVIIGFLHLVFLGFVTFYILSSMMNGSFYERNQQFSKWPFLVFSGGIILNELLLMLQGLGILFRTNSTIYSWLLWIAAITLFIGALMIAITTRSRANEKVAEIKRAA
jgi:hypothetical protein